MKRIADHHKEPIFVSSNLDQPWDVWPGFSGDGEKTRAAKGTSNDGPAKSMEPEANTNQHYGPDEPTGLYQRTGINLEEAANTGRPLTPTLGDMIKQHVVDGKNVLNLADRCSNLQTISLPAVGPLNPRQASSLISLLKDVKAVQTFDMPYIATSHDFSTEKNKWFWVSVFEQMSRYDTMQNLTISVKNNLGNEEALLFGNALQKLIRLEKMNLSVKNFEDAAFAIDKKIMLQKLTISTDEVSTLRQSKLRSDDERTMYFFGKLLNYPKLAMLDMTGAPVMPRPFEYFLDLLPNLTNLTDLKVSIVSTGEKRKEPSSSRPFKPTSLRNLSIKTSDGVAEETARLLQSAPLLTKFECLKDPSRMLYFEKNARQPRFADRPNLLFNALGDCNLRLKHLTVDAVRFSKDSFADLRNMLIKLPNIEAVRMSNVDFEEQAHVSLSDVFFAFTAAPSLLSLEWSQREWASLDNQADNFKITGSFQSLKSLTIQADLPGDVSPVWPNMPELKALVLRGYSTPSHLPEPSVAPILTSISTASFDPLLAQKYASKFPQGHKIEINDTSYTSN